MKTLIAEDDFVSRLVMQKIFEAYGPYQLAENGQEAVEAVRVSLRMRKPFDLICLDIMMPKMDGQEALKQIRELEEEHKPPLDHRAKIIMTTALADRDNVIQAGQHHCDAYLVKPLSKTKLLDELRKLDLVAPETEPIPIPTKDQVSEQDTECNE